MPSEELQGVRSRLKTTLRIPLTDPSALENAVPTGRPINRKLEEFYATPS